MKTLAITATVFMLSSQVNAAEGYKMPIKNARNLIEAKVTLEESELQACLYFNALTYISEVTAPDIAISGIIEACNEQPGRTMIPSYGGDYLRRPDFRTFMGYYTLSFNHFKKNVSATVSKR
jgi:hypothetical protein